MSSLLFLIEADTAHVLTGSQRRLQAHCGVSAIASRSMTRHRLLPGERACIYCTAALQGLTLADAVLQSSPFSAPGGSSVKESPGSSALTILPRPIRQGR
jgi:hypothetical protein